MNKKIIAFCGAKGSGKSTSADLFKDLVKGSKVTKEVAFAGHLKTVCSEVFNIDMKYFLDPKLKESELQNYVNLTITNIEQVFEKFEIAGYSYDPHIRNHCGQVFDTPRKLLQYVGTELLHPLDKLIHVNFAMKKIDLEAITLVTDMRFPQEFDAMYGREDFLPVYVKNTKAELEAEADSHASEKGWQTFKDRCIVLDNERSVGDLIDNLKILIGEYYGL